MRSEIITTMCMAILAIILILSLIAILVYEKGQKKQTLGMKRADDDWLFSNFQKNVFHYLEQRDYQIQTIDLLMKKSF